MKSICTTLLLPATLAGAFLLSGCSSWHATGETVVGDPTIAHTSANLKSPPIRGSAAASAKPAAAAPAKPTKGKAAASSSGSGTGSH